MKTSKKILSLILSLALVFSLAACGGSDTQPAPPAEKIPLLENVTSQQWENIRPVDDYAQTDEEFMALWKYKSTFFLDGGSTYGGIPTVNMTKDRLKQEFVEDGYTLNEKNDKLNIAVQTDSYIIEASKAVKADYVSELKIQFFNIDEEDFDWSKVDEVNSRLSLSNSQQLLGMTLNEMFSTMGLTEGMINWLKDSEDGHRSWYEDNNDHWYFSYKEEPSPSGGLNVSLHMSRSGSQIEETIMIMNRGDYVGSILYQTYIPTEETLANRAKYAEKYRQEN